LSPRYRLGGNSATANCADVDNDGWMDLVTSEIVHWDVGQSSDRAELMVNTKDPNVVFTRPGNSVTGLARTYPVIGWNEGIMTGSIFDFDNDGWADVYMGNSDYPFDHGLLFHQDKPDHFVAVPLAQGIDHHRSHGSAVADFDHDGDLDIVVGHSFARCHQDAMDDSECYATQQVRFFENVLGDKGNFLTVRLVGGAGEATILARVGEGIVSTIGSAESHKDVLEHPDSISKTVLGKGLDAGTAYEILSIDIADVEVGVNIGAKLQMDQANADKNIAQAKAEERRAMAIALEQENLARIQEMRSRLVEAEAQIPMAMAEALRTGKIGVMDYYGLRNLQADTEMRQSLSQGKELPPKV